MNTNNPVPYLCLQELAPEAVKYFLAFYGDARVYTVSNSSFVTSINS